MDISRIADLPAVNQTNLTRPAEQRTEMKSSTLAAEHTDSFIKSQAAFTPAYTKKSAQKQSSDNNLLQRENSGERIEAAGEGGASRVELMTQGVRHIIRAMFVKQGEVLSGSVPSVGAKLYAEELLSQIRRLYGSTEQEENTAEYWQSEPAAQRLMTFFECVSVEGDRRELITRAFNGAFEDAEELFGGRGRLPLECYETRRIIRENYILKPDVAE